MTQKNRPTGDEEKSALDSRQSAKKPYIKPAFRSEKVFETMALAYGKYLTRCDAINDDMVRDLFRSSCSLLSLGNNSSTI